MIRTEQGTVFSWPSRGEMCALAGCHKFVPPIESCEVVHTQDGHACLVLHVTGGVDSRTAGELIEELEAALGANQVSRLILDLEGVSRMDSSGVGALLAGLHNSQEQHVRFTLCGLRKPLYDMLDRTHLAGLFEIRPTVDEALSR